MSAFGWGCKALWSSESPKSLYFFDIAPCWNSAKGTWTCLLSHIWLIPMEVDPTFEQASATAKPRSNDGFELSEMSTVSPSQFLLQQEQSELVRHHDSSWDACAYSRKSPAKDSPNEDAIGIFQFDANTTIFAVADGCGGMRGGEQASSIALQMLADSIERHQDGPERLRFSIIEGIELANAAIQDLKIGAACTIAVIECTQGTIRPYHVGDSMILVTSNRGKVRYQSVSHSPVGFAVESGMLCANEAMHHEDRHIVSNLVGDARMRIEMGPVLTLAPRDTVLIASDGLFDNLSVAEVVEHVRKGNLRDSVKAACELAYDRMLGIKGQPCKPDDLSVVAARLSKLKQSNNQKSPDWI